jgi:hypothetical protein
VIKQQANVVMEMTDTLIITSCTAETGFLTINTVTRQDLDNYEDGDCGLPLPDLEFRIYDTDDQLEIFPHQVFLIST